MAGLEQHVRMLRQSRMSTLQSAVLLQRLHSDRREFSTVRDDARRAVNQAGALLLRARAARERAETIQPRADIPDRGTEDEWSGRLDSNQRHLAPKASALPG